MHICSAGLLQSCRPSGGLNKPLVGLRPCQSCESGLGLRLRMRCFPQERSIRYFSISHSLVSAWPTYEDFLDTTPLAAKWTCEAQQHKPDHRARSVVKERWPKSWASAPPVTHTHSSPPCPTAKCAMRTATSPTQRDVGEFDGCCCLIKGSQPDSVPSEVNGKPHIDCSGLWMRRYIHRLLLL